VILPAVVPSPVTYQFVPSQCNSTVSPGSSAVLTNVMVSSAEQATIAPLTTRDPKIVFSPPEVNN